MEEDKIKLYGKFFISGTITTKTGLVVGGSNVGLEIGGADMVVVREKLTNMPYIPGSSLKGAIRSLLEKAGRSDGTTYPLLPVVGKDETDRLKKVMIHICQKKEDYQQCPICKIFGVSAGEEGFTPEPTRLIVRDALLDDSETELGKSTMTDMPYTELKTEVVIDRLTSKATPRQLERVPAGSEFKFEMVFNVYEPSDIDYLKDLFSGMELLEGDYLGGQGSRGSGQIRFGKFERGDAKEVNFDSIKEDLKIEWKSVKRYFGQEDNLSRELKKDDITFIPSKLKEKITNLTKEIKEEIEKQGENKPEGGEQNASGNN